MDIETAIQNKNVSPVELGGAIQATIDMKRVFPLLDEEQKTQLFPLIEEKIIGFCVTIDDISMIFPLLNPEQKKTIYNKIEERLIQLTIDGEKFNTICGCLDNEQRNSYYEKMKVNGFFEAIESTKSLSWVLWPLPVEQCVEVFEQITKITIDDDLGMCLIKLPPEQSERLLLREQPIHLDNLVLQEDLRTFYPASILDHYYQRIYELIKNRKTEGAPSMTLTSSNVEIFLESILPDRRTKVYEALGIEDIVALIETSDDLSNIIRHLNFEQCASIIKALDNKLINLFKNATDFIRCLRTFDEHEPEIAMGFKAQLYQAFGVENLVPLIKNRYDFERIYKILGPETQKELAKQYPLTIPNARELANLLNTINNSDVPDFLGKLRLSPNNLLEVFDGGQPISFFETLNEDKMLTTLNVFKANDRFMKQTRLEPKKNWPGGWTSDNKAEHFYNTFKDEINESLKELISLRHSNIILLAYDAIYDRMPTLIQSASADELNSLLRSFPIEEMGIFFNDFSKEFNGIINSPEKLLTLINNLDDAKVKLIYEKITHFKFDDANDFKDKLKKVNLSILGTTTGIIDLFATTSAAEKKQRLSPLLMKFELALISQDNDNIKQAFLDLAKNANTHRRSPILFSFGKTRSFTQLLDEISKNKEVREPLATALGIVLPSEKHNDIKQAFEKY